MFTRIGPGHMPVIDQPMPNRTPPQMLPRWSGLSSMLIGRPVMWGLAAYGAEGVQTVLEMLQTEVGRDMGHAGTPTFKALNRNFIKVHRA